MYTIHIQPKKQFKVQIIGILEEIGSFIDQKCTSWKCEKNLGRAPPHLDKILKNSSTFSGERPYFLIQRQKVRQILQLGDNLHRFGKTFLAL